MADYLRSTVIIIQCNSRGFNVQTKTQRTKCRSISLTRTDRVSLCHISHHTPVYLTSCFYRELVEHSIEQQRALLPVMPIYGIACLLNGRKRRWMIWLLEIVSKGICQNLWLKRRFLNKHSFSLHVSDLRLVHVYFQALKDSSSNFHLINCFTGHQIWTFVFSSLKKDYFSLWPNLFHFVQLPYE